MLETGETDYAWNLQIAPDELNRLEGMGDGTTVVAFSSLVERVVLNQTNPDPALGDDRSEFMNGNNAHPFLSNEDIRKAMSMAIDRERLAADLYGVAGQATCNLITGPPNYESSSNDECLTQDIATANRLLDNVGAVDTNGDGVREFNGTPLSVVFQTSTNDVRQTTQELISEWWSLIGIDVTITHHDAALFFGGDPIDDAAMTYRRFFADVQMYANGTGIDPQSYLSDLICNHVPTREDNWSLGNIARACDPEYDDVYERFTAIPTGVARDELIKRLNDLYVHSYVEIPLVNRGSVSAHLETLKGVRMNAWDSELWNIAEWER